MAAGAAAETPPEGRRVAGAHFEHRPEWGAFFAEDFHAEVLQFVESGGAGIREEQQVECGIVRQGLLLDGQGQQRRLEFEVRLVGQDGLGPRVRLQLLRDGLGSANEISLVGDVGHDDRPGGLQARAEGIVQRRAGLDHVSAGIALGAQVIGDGQGEGLGGVEQGVFEQDGGWAADQLAEGRGGVGEAEGKGVRVACCVHPPRDCRGRRLLRERLLGWRRVEGAGLAEQREG